MRPIVSPNIDADTRALVQVRSRDSTVGNLGQIRGQNGSVVRRVFVAPYEYRDKVIRLPIAIIRCYCYFGVVKVDARPIWELLEIEIAAISVKNAIPNTHIKYQVNYFPGRYWCSRLNARDPEYPTKESWAPCHLDCPNVPQSAQENCLTSPARVADVEDVGRSVRGPNCFQNIWHDPTRDLLFVTAPLG